MTEKETSSGQVPATDSTGSPQAGSGQAPSIDLGQALRRRAEEIARGKSAQMPENMESLSPEEARRLLHELRVHQIELEMQNEELRRAQAELEASRARYFDLYHLASVGYFTVSEKGLILEANHMAATLLGVSRGTLVGQPLSRFILPEDQDIYYRHRKLLFETNAPQACELRLVKKDAAPFWVRLEAAAAQDGESGAPLYLAVMSNITDHKQAEETLRELEEMYQALLEGSRYGILLVDIETRRFVYANPSICRMLGYSDVELQQLNIADIHPKGSLDHMMSEFESRIRGGKQMSPAILCLRKDGSVFYADIGVSIAIVRGRRCAMGFFADVTERKRAEEALLQSKAELEQTNRYLEEAKKETEILNRTLEERVEKRTRELQESTMELIQAEKLAALGELTASVAHELKQPLNSIKIISQAILRDIDKKRFDEQSARDDLPEIIHQVDKMAEIIDHMRVFTRRPIHVPNEMVDLNLVIGDALKFVGQQLKDHNIDIVMELDSDLPKVLGDSVRLEQVVVNLINNARHAVEINGKEEKRIEVRTGKGSDGQTVSVEVKDNGIGILEEVKKKIFQPFFTTKEPGKGTGLGLSVSKKILDEHKGTLEFFSNAGEGALFRLLMPVINNVD